MGSERSSRFAVVVAAGRGRRFGGKKQNILMHEGHPMYWYSLRAFDLSSVDEMILVVCGEDIPDIGLEGIKKKVTVVAGGEERYHSVYNGIRAIDNASENDIVMIHDGARPAITVEMIERLIEDTEKYGACAASIPVVDTIRLVGNDHRGGEIVDRSRLRAMQTPQCFRYGIIASAYEKLMTDEKTLAGVKITDDVQVAELETGVRAHLSEGSPLNIKVTTEEDIIRLEKAFDN